MNPAANHRPLPKFVVWSVAVDSVRRILWPFGPLSPVPPPRSGQVFDFLNGFAKMRFPSSQINTIDTCII